MRSVWGRVVWGVLVACLAAATTAAGAAAKGRPYSTPGYHWNHKLPKVAPVIPGKLIHLGDGLEPRVLVDAAGTGQIAYNVTPTDISAPSVLHDCVLMRGQTGCASNAGLIPPETGSPEYNIDERRPPAAVGRQRAADARHRFPMSETLPDGTTGYPTFLWTSEDAGKTFTGPGMIGNLETSGNAVVFGGDQPQIGVITDTRPVERSSGHASGRVLRPALNLGDQGPDEAYNGRLAVDGSGRWPSSPTSPTTSSSASTTAPATSTTRQLVRGRIDGQGYSRLVGGPSGVWLLYQKTYAVRCSCSGSSTACPPARPTRSRPTATSATPTTRSPRTRGADHRRWFYFVNSTELFVPSSTDGRHWSVPQTIARNLQSPSDLALGAAQDGGGFAAFKEPEPGGVSHYQIEVAAFGSFVATGLKGLGNLDGAGLGGLGGDPLASTSCTDVHFGAIDALAEAGCFLRDPRNPTSGAAVIQGEVRLNGLEMIPDAGVQIVIDPRKHTINTTGAVRVVLRAPGIGDITLYHGALNVNLSGSLADAGHTLFDFDTATASTLEGFPFDGSIDVQIQHDGVVIPVSLKLPPYMGGVTGAGDAARRQRQRPQAQLAAHRRRRPGARRAGDQEPQHRLRRHGNVWTGSATLNIPAGTPYFGIDVAVRFDDGDFTMGSFNVNVPFPGVPIFTDTYLDGFGGGFDIHPDKRSFHGSVSVGAIPLDPPNYTIGVTGTVTITFINNGPVVLEVDGTGSVHGFRSPPPS